MIFQETFREKKREFGSKLESIQEACTKTDLDYYLLVGKAKNASC